MNIQSANAFTVASEISERALAAISGKPFVLSSYYSDDQWDDVIAAYVRGDSDASELEFMLDMDAAHERYSDWLGRDYERRWATDFTDWLPRHGYGHLVRGA